MYRIYKEEKEKKKERVMKLTLYMYVVYVCDSASMMFKTITKSIFLLFSLVLFVAPREHQKE